MMDMNEVRRTARERMKGFCRVCPECDGRACIGEVPGMGGLGTASAFHANVDALRDVALKTRLLHDVTAPDLHINILGMSLSLPVIAAPIGGVSFNMGGKVTENQYCAAIVEGCMECGTVGCLGDGVPAFILDSAIEAATAAGGHAIPFIKPWSDAEFYEKVDRVVDAGCMVMGMDVDAVGLVTLAKMGRPVLPRKPEALRVMIQNIHDKGMKFILKGIMSVEDAVLAEAVGCDAIVVSNHGGRIFDVPLSAVDVLPEIAHAVRHVEILADGGVRSGVDVLKMLALGAKAVMIGRPFSVVAVGGGKEGVELYLEKIRGELTSAMVLTGCPSAETANGTLLA